MNYAEPGRLVAGRYRLGEVIGRGGMGVVWRARDELLSRDVAVKEIVWPPGFTEQEQQAACRRATREARVAARLSHRNVIRIYDIVEEDGRPWIVMELLSYRSLRDIVDEDGPLSPEQTARVGLGILGALRVADEAGIAHRDVKPANVLVGPDGRVVLTDFGIAWATDSTTMSTAGMLIGSPSYIAPERAKGGYSGVAGDLWGLGATLYTTVEGHPPFDRGSALASVTAVVTEEPDPPEHAGMLWPVIRGLLRKDPAERLGIAEAGRMLHQVADMPAAPEPGIVPGMRTSPEPEVVPGQRRPRGKVAGLAAVATLVLLAAVAAGLALAGSPRHQAASPAAGTGSGTRSSAPASPHGSVTGRATAGSPPAAPSSPVTGNPSTGNARTGTGPAGIATGPAGTDALPAGYSRFTNATGFSIGVPRGWVISHAGHYVYIRDPANSGIFLLIDQSDSPKPDPLADWEQQQASRAAGYPDYHLIRLQAVNYAQAEKAADWEFTYSRGGTLVHVLNRNVLANARHAYALYWSTPDSQWDAYYRYFEAFAATFRPAPA